MNWLAGELGMVQSTVARQLERNDPSLALVIGAATVLDVPVSQILRGDMEPPAPNGGTGGIAERERLDLLRLLGFVSQVVASGPVSSQELLDDLKALASVLHVMQVERGLPGGETLPEE